MKVGVWVAERRKEHRTGRVQPWIAAELERIPAWSWAPAEDRQRRRIAVLRDYVTRHGWFAFTENRAFEIVHQGVNLTRVISQWRRSRAVGHVPELCDEIETIPGWRWEPGRASFEAYREAVATLIARSPRRERDLVIRNLVGLALWATSLRQYHAKGTDDAWLVRALRAVPGWRWS